MGTVLHLGSEGRKSHINALSARKSRTRGGGGEEHVQNAVKNRRVFISTKGRNAVKHLVDEDPQ
jgi:hypothetical protein